MVRLSPDSFVLMLPYCVNLKAIRYESTSLNRIVGDKSHHVIVARTVDSRYASIKQELGEAKMRVRSFIRVLTVCQFLVVSEI